MDCFETMLFGPRHNVLERMEDLEEVCKKTFAFEEVAKDCFRPESLFHARQSPNGAAFGGLIFSQALAAAESTVDDMFKPNSMHSYFVLPVNHLLPVTYHVKRVRDGRSFVNRTVEAVQNDKLCFIFQASFHKLEKESMIHKRVDMPAISGPEGFTSMRQAVIRLQELVKEGKLSLKPGMQHRLMALDNKAYVLQNEVFEVRCTDIGSYYGFASDFKPESCFWMRVKGDLRTDDERIHRWLIALMSDATLLPTAMSPHFSKGFEDSIHASLDHSLWFHRSDVHADEWVLVECRSTVSSGARCLIEGRIWTRDGTLVASCRQEALVRGKDGQVSKI